MKLYKYLLILPILLIFSCDLDREPNGISNFWKTKGDVQMGLDAAYAPFYEEEGFGRGHYWADVSDDLVYNRARGNEDPLAAFTTNVNSSGPMFENWRLMYRTIKRANDVIKNAPDVDMTDNERNIILGEANFITAFSYFYLAKRFGGLPFYDYKFPDEINKPRETKTDTFKRIVAYLEESIRFFEKENAWHRGQGAEGRPSLGAAHGLLAKVYMHWGGEENFKKAKSEAEKVINSGEYALETMGGNGFAYLFSPEGEKSKEVLFNLVNTPTRHEGTIVSIVLMSKELTGGTGWYYFAPTKSLYNAFDPGDQRRAVTMKGAGDQVSYPPLIAQLQVAENKAAAVAGREPLKIKAPVTITKDMIKDMNTGYMGTKYASAYDNLNSWNWEAGADQPLLRYADVLLLHAEAEMMLAGGGPNNPTKVVPAAAESFNKVRVRAFGNDATKAIAAPNFNQLMKERRCELAYEDERHFDLVRWGLAKEVYANGENVEDPRKNRAFDTTKDNHFPIPQREIENTGFLLINNPNPGYSTFVTK